MKMKTTAVLISMGLLFASQSALVSAEPRERRGAPPEAYTACEGKNAGDSAEFKNRRGRTVSGTCQEQNGRLVLRPERKRGQGNGGDQARPNKRHNPPPAAYTACEGKKAGDTAQFEGRRGRTVTGTCQEQNGKLVVRPNKPKHHKREQRPQNQ